MKYQNKTFSVPYTSKQYRDNWDSVFNPPNFDIGDLVAVEDHCGYWCKSNWFEEKEPTFWFGIVERIDSFSRFEDDPNCTIKVGFFHNESATKTWEWVDKNKVYLVAKDIKSFLRKGNSSDSGKEEGVGTDKPKQKGPCY